MDALQQTVLSVAKQLEDKVDDEITKLENLNERELQAIRKQRVEELRKQAVKKEEWLRAGHGEYTEVGEKEFFSEVKSSDRVVCHFYRENWPCKVDMTALRSPIDFCPQVMDKHLATLCSRHIETRFTKVHAEKAPFLTERLHIVVLPTLALIRKGKVEDYVVGFDELGGTDDFDTKTLEERLALNGYVFADEVAAPAPSKGASVKRGLAFQKTASDEDSDFDD